MKTVDVYHSRKRILGIIALGNKYHLPGEIQRIKEPFINDKEIIVILFSNYKIMISNSNNSNYWCHRLIKLIGFKRKSGTEYEGKFDFNQNVLYSFEMPFLLSFYLKNSKYPHN